MARLAIPFVGQAYKHRSLSISAQTCKNWFVEVNAESPALSSLQPWPGQKLFSSGSGILDRGMTVHNGSVYEITDQTLSSVDSSGTKTVVGTINGNQRAYFASTGTTLVIVSGGNVYSLTDTSLTLATDSDFESPDYVTYINNQALYDGSDSRFAVSDAGNLTSIAANNYASAEALGDEIIRPYAFLDSEQVFMFCTKHIETWWNSGAGTPPFDRIQGGSFSIGLEAGASVSSNENATYFLGDDLLIHRIFSGAIENITSIPVSQAISSYKSPSEAIGYCLSYDSQNFYVIRFQEACWVYSEANNSWFELTTGNDEQSYKATSYAFGFNKHLVKVQGNIYELDPNTATNDGEAIIRERVSGLISGKLLGPANEGRQIFMNSIEVVVRAEADVFGEGFSPTFLLAVSDDNGRTYIQREVTAAPAGNYNWRIKAYQLGCFYERVVRVICSDPINWSIQSAIADVEIGE